MLRLIRIDHPIITGMLPRNSWVSCTVIMEGDQMISSPVVLLMNVVVVPHGVAYETFEAATASEVPQMQISEGAIAFMFESSRPFTISEYAWKSNKMHEHDPKMWGNLVDNFSNHPDIIALLGGKKHGSAALKQTDESFLVKPANKSYFFQPPVAEKFRIRVCQPPPRSECLA